MLKTVNHKEFDEFIKLSRDGIIVITDGIITTVNPVIEQFLKLNKNDIIGKRFIDFVGNSEKNRIKDLYYNSNFKYESNTFYETQILDSKNNNVYIEFSAIPIKYNDKKSEFVILRNISDKKKNENELKWFKALIDMSADSLVFTDENEKIVYANASWENMHRINKKDIIGKHHSKFYKKNDYDTKVKELIRKAYKNGFASKEIEHIDKNGNYIPTLTTCTYYKKGSHKTGYLYAAINIANYKKMESTLKKNEYILRQITNNIDEIFYLFDVKKRSILYVSPLFEKLFLTSTKSLIYSPVNLIKMIHKKDRKNFLNFIRNSENHGKYIDHRVICGDKSIKWIRLKIFFINDHKNKLERTAAIAWDITDHISQQQNLKERKKQLEQTDKMVSLGILVSGIAHEINNPNNLIMLNYDILKNIWKDILKILDQKYKQNNKLKLANLPYKNIINEFDDLFTGIKEGSERIRNIVSNLKDFARLGTEDQNELIDMNTVIDKAIVIVNNLISKSTDFFVKELEHNIPEIKGNFQRLEQVIINLITNACQAIENKSKKLIIKTYMNNKQNKLIVEVIDEGQGINKNELNKIFDPFYTTKRDLGGTGLGLSISYGIIQDHNGEIIVVSEKGKGTAVKIILPPAY